MIRENIINFNTDKVIIKALERGIACIRKDDRFLFTCNDYNRVVNFVTEEFGEIKTITNPFNGTKKEVISVPFDYEISG